MEKKRLGILYICTGTYEFFWKDFYRSAELYFMQDSSWVREYYVFTDSPLIYDEENNPHIHRIEQANLGWPDNSMMRFEMFLRIRERLEKETDYVYYLNANAEFQVPVGEDILPDKGGNGLVGVINTWQMHKRTWEYSYERRHQSATYIPIWQGKHYFGGGLWGGTVPAVMKLCEVCLCMVLTDKKNGIIPRWHDESTVNRYFVDHPPKVLHTGYNYSYEAEEYGYVGPIDVKIRIRKKTDYFPMEELSKGNVFYQTEMPRWYNRFLYCVNVFRKIDRRLYYVKRRLKKE